MKAGFLEKLIERLGRIGPEEVQNYFLRLAQEKGFLETVFNAIHEGIIVTDSNGRVTYLNDAGRQRGPGFGGLRRGKQARGHSSGAGGARHHPARHYREPAHSPTSDRVRTRECAYIAGCRRSARNW